MGMIGMNSPLAELARRAKESITIPRMTIYWLTRDERDLVRSIGLSFLSIIKSRYIPRLLIWEILKCPACHRKSGKHLNFIKATESWNEMVRALEKLSKESEG